MRALIQRWRLARLVAAMCRAGISLPHALSIIAFYSDHGILHLLEEEWL